MFHISFVHVRNWNELTDFRFERFSAREIPLLECDPRILQNEASLTVPSELNGQIDFSSACHLLDRGESQ